MSSKKRTRKPLSEDGRIHITSSNYLHNVKLLMSIFGVLSVSGIIVLFLLMGVTYTSIAISMTAVLFSGWFIYYILKNTRCISLKGENLLLNAIGNHNQVAPLRSIKFVKSIPLAGFQLTRIRYKLDGRTVSFFIFSGKLDARSPEQYLKTSIAKVNEKKKKANHKPGSVYTQSA